ncbi:MAG: hypothetical protein V1706_14870 [Pseudomonadota bacterium]
MCAIGKSYKLLIPDKIKVLILMKSTTLYKILPNIVNFLTTLSVKKAAIKLRTTNTKRILVDNSVLGHSVTHETAWISTGKQPWGDQKIDTGYTARIPVRSENDTSVIANSVKYLPGIANLAKRGLMLLATSQELEDERFTQPTGRFRGYGICDFSPFSDLKFEMIDDSEGSIVIASSYPGTPSIETQRKKRLESKTDPLYRKLVSVLGPKNSQDAWHIVTAEHNNCYCFLTMDFKLVRNIRAQSKNATIKSLKTKILTPEEFGKELGIIPMSPRLYSYHNADYPVRHDINWPDSKRRKHRKRE